MILRKSPCACSFQASVAIVFVLVALCAQAQNSSYQRAFPQSKAAIEKALKTLQPSLSGRLPVLDGFAKAGEHPLDRYQRGFYQTTVEVTSSGSGSVVHISTKVTAWYADPETSNSGYQLLKSNGRIEGDLLDQLEEQLAKGTAEKSPASSAPATVNASEAPSKPTVEAKTEPAASTPSPKFPSNDRTFSSSLKPTLPSREEDSGKTPDQLAGKSPNSLQAEVESLQEIAKNVAHPKNLVAVKKSGTPVVAKPSLTAKPEFLASLHDEFEMLDFNTDWVHVRISGLSRGWIWRNSVEMPEGIPDTAAPTASAGAAAADLFHVMREEIAPFPGDWEPLRGKNVKIISVQNADESSKDAGPKERLEFAKFLLDKSYKEVSEKPQELQGVVVIFDAADGGMIAATTVTLQQWRAGTLSDAALWHKCFFDPPETFESAAPSGSK
ncbi:MAG: hypothetical protein WCB05_05225 [Candidatus Sulfotelmatobacter sp.]